MLPTYKAILRGNHVEWLGDGDQQPALDDPVAVNITILDEPVAPEVLSVEENLWRPPWSDWLR